MKTTFPIPNSLLLTLLAITLPSVLAGVAPTISGFTITWSDAFAGAAGSPPSTTYWQHETPTTNSNNEVQHYTSSPLNANLSGQSTLYITPLYTTSTGWTSARLSTYSSWTCADDAEMIVQARIKLGDNDPTHQHGMWPAFWTLGESIRAPTNTPWPECGEWDIMEQFNGGAQNLGTAHWGTSSSPQALSSPWAYYDKTLWHTYSVRISRIGGWLTQSITWELDGSSYYVLTGAMVGNYSNWADLVAKPYYILLNVAVGGDATDGPNADTWGGQGSGMEVGYVAVYNGA